MSPSVTVVVPCYNCEKTIVSCLNSILNSKLLDRDIEIIAVDNNSTDRTKELIQSIDGIKYILEEQQGRSFARNRGIAESSHSLIAFLDADVVISEDWIEHVAQKFAKRNMGGCQGRIVPVSCGDKPTWLDKYRDKEAIRSTNGTYTILDIFCYETPMINSAACMYSKKALEHVGGFDVRLERHEDIDLSRRVFYSGFDLSACRDAVASVYFHGDGIADYLSRAFLHGYHKNEYYDKWEKLESTLNNLNVTKKDSFAQNDLSTELFGGVSFKSFQIRFKQTSAKLDWIWAIKHLTGKLARAVLFLDRDAFFYFVCNFLQSYGRLYGKYFGKKLDFSSDKLNIIARDSEIILGRRSQSMRPYVRLLYLGDEVVSFDLSQKKYSSLPGAFGKVLNFGQDDDIATILFEGLSSLGIVEDTHA